MSWRCDAQSPRPYVAATIELPSGVSVRLFTATCGMPVPRFDQLIGWATSATNTPTSIATDQLASEDEQVPCGRAGEVAADVPPNLPAVSRLVDMATGPWCGGPRTPVLSVHDVHVMRVGRIDPDRADLSVGKRVAGVHDAWTDHSVPLAPYVRVDPSREVRVRFAEHRAAPPRVDRVPAHVEGRHHPPVPRVIQARPVALGLRAARPPGRSPPGARSR